jgi:hypothetical protein
MESVLAPERRLARPGATPWTRKCATALDFRFRLLIHPVRHLVRHSLGGGGSFSEGGCPLILISKNKARERLTHLAHHEVVGKQIQNIANGVRLPCQGLESQISTKIWQRNHWQRNGNKEPWFYSPAQHSPAIHSMAQLLPEFFDESGLTRQRKGGSHNAVLACRLRAETTMSLA